jgi:hypothetical protein
MLYSTQLAIQASSYCFFFSRQDLPFSRMLSLVSIVSGSRIPQDSRQAKYSSRTFQQCCRSRRDGGLLAVSASCFDMTVSDKVVCCGQFSELTLPKLRKINVHVTGFLCASRSWASASWMKVAPSLIELARILLMGTQISLVTCANRVHLTKRYFHQSKAYQYLRTVLFG